jgi:SRSO17 transposase
MLPESFIVCLVCFQDCFTQPSFQRFLTLMTGWILCISKHTVTSVIRAAGVAGKREHGGYHRFFNTASWSVDEVGLALMRLILTLLPDDCVVRLNVDDTLARHTGKHIAAAGMHRDPLLSTAKKPFFHFGHQSRLWRFSE